MFDLFEEGKLAADQVKSVLASYPEIHIGIVYGSLVKNRLTPKSDVDVAIACDEPIEFKKRLSIMDALSRATHRDIDLIDLRTVSGPILREALCEGMIIKKTNTLLLASLIKKMWYNQADWMPNMEFILRNHCERFVNG